MALERAGQQRQALFQLAGSAVRIQQALRDQGDVGRILGFDPLPVLDRALGVARRLFQVAQLQAGAHRFAV